MRMINTISCISYNTVQREKLYQEYLKLDEECRKISDDLDRAMDITDATEDDTQEKEVEKLLDDAKAKRRFLYNSCFAAQFPKCKNQWFNKIIEELPNDESYKYLTKRQIECFSQYACHKDDYTWRNHESYCRSENGDYLVIFSTLGYIKKVSIKS